MMRANLVRSGVGLLVFLAVTACKPSAVPATNAEDANPTSKTGPQATGDDGAAAPAPTPAADKRPPGPPVDDVDELPELEGKSPDEVVGRLGPFDATKNFVMADCCHEFEIELYNTYPPGEGHDEVAIRRLDWAFDGYAVSVWFHKPEGEWVALDTCRYGDNVEF